MFFTGFTRFSSDIQKTNKLSGKKDKKLRLKRMYELVDQAQEILVNKNKNLDDFGHLLDETWNLKKKTGTIISNDSIDHFYRRGIDAGALGGKLLGAGGGGFLIFYVEKRVFCHAAHLFNGIIQCLFNRNNGLYSLLQVIANLPHEISAVTQLFFHPGHGRTDLLADGGDRSHRFIYL